MSENDASMVGNEEAMAKIAEYKEMVQIHREEISKLTKALHDNDFGHVHMKFKELSYQSSNKQNENFEKVEDVLKTLDEQKKKSQQTCQSQSHSQSQVNDKGQMRTVPSYAEVLSKVKSKL